jgi:hypothetical protein
MVIVVVRWYIKTGRDQQFKDVWKDMNPENKEGLFREFFSKPTDILDEKYHTLDLESKHYTAYINVGIWRALKDFDNVIGSLIPGREKHPDKSGKELIELFDFELKLRERIVMDVETTRGGKWMLPDAAL